MSQNQNLLGHERLLLLVTHLTLGLAFLFLPEGLRAQYIYQLGSPTFTTSEPVELGFINVANGNLHLEIPLAAPVQRGSIPYSARLVYDSRIWAPIFVYGSFLWSPTNVPGSQGGWRKIETGAGTVGFDHTQGSCTYTCRPGTQCTAYYDIWSRYYYRDFSGAKHYFPIYVEGGNLCHIPDPNKNTTSGSSTDATGYYMSAGGGGVNSVKAGDGNYVYLPPGDATTPRMKDTNGNYYTVDASGFVHDTLNRTPLTWTTSGNTTTYTVQTAAGPANIVVTTTTVYVHTLFQKSGVTEYQGHFSAISSIQLPDNGGSYSFAYDTGTSDTDPNIHYGLLTSVTLPSGGVITYNHTKRTDVNGNINMWVSSRASGGGTWNFGAPTSCGTNCQKVIITKPGGSDQTVYSFTLNNGAWSTVVEAYQGSAGGTLLAKAQNDYESNTDPLGGGGAYFRLLRTTTTLGSVVKKTEYSYNSFNFTYRGNSYTGSTGDLTEKRKYAFSSGTPGGLLRKTSISYGVYNHPGSITIQDGSGATKAQTDFSYDSHGNLLSETRYTGGTPATISRSFTYSASGVLQTATDFSGHQTTYTNNGCSSSFPTTISLPMSLSRSMTWNCNGGVPSSVTDENSQPTSLSYENLWRPSSVDLPGDAQVSWIYNDTASPPNVVTTTKLTTSMNRVDTARYDGLGRVTQAQLADPEGDDKVDATYDDLGRTSTVSNPYRSIAEPTYGITAYYYDPLDRLTSIVRPESSTATITYSANCATSADEAGKARTVCTDALGRVTSVTEDPSGLNYQTTYTYDVLDNLTSVSQGGQTRSYTYDMLSRLTQAATPESGTVNFTYDANGNVLTRVAPKPNQSASLTVTTTYTYDALNRLTGKSYDDGATPTANYYYDQTSYNGLTITNGQGRRTGMSDASGQTAWSYDALGHVVSAQKTISGVTKTISYAYNLDGSVASVTYPSGRTVNYDIQSAGRPTYAKDTANGINYALNATYAPHGALAGMLNGQGGTFGGITFSASYNNRLLPSNLTASSSNGTALNLSYSYFGNGTVQTITNNRDTGRTATYSYDALNRVTSGQSTATSGADCWGQSIPTDGTGYDRWGNLLKINSTQCNSWSLNVGVDSNNRITNAGFSYDAAGELLTDGTYTYQWDAEGRVTTVTSSLQGTETYTYDGLGARVKKATAARLYWYGAGGEELGETDLSGSNLGEWIYFQGQRVARHDPTPVYYLYPDTLGSLRALTDATGHLTRDSDFYLFGQEKWMGGAGYDAYQFAGLYRDTEDLNHTALFRRYNPSLGRWLSPDPLGGDILNPQSLNRYAYALNNPTNLIDPLGLDPPQGPPPHPGCGDDPTTACVWERYHWTIPGMFGAGLTCYVDQVKTPCDMTFGLVQSGAAYPLPPRGEGWEPVRRGAQPDCPGCFYNPQTDQTWDPDNPLSWGASWNLSTLPPDARVVFSQVAKATSTLTTGRFYVYWTGAAIVAAEVSTGFAGTMAVNTALIELAAAYPSQTAFAIQVAQGFLSSGAVPTVPTMVGRAAKIIWNLIK